MIRLSQKLLRNYLEVHPECFSEVEKYPGWTVFDVVKNKIQPVSLRYCLTCRQTSSL